MNGIKELNNEILRVTKSVVVHRQEYSKFGGFEGYSDIYTMDIARHLHEVGYRKQTEGKWKKRGNEKTCSLCKFIYYSNNDEWNFCPNCGAKMKGE